MSVRTRTDRLRPPSLPADRQSRVAPKTSLAPPTSVAPVVAEKRPREPKVKVKNDPRLVAAARELRDRWLEQVNATPLLASGKYDVSRVIEGNATDGPLSIVSTVFESRPALPSPVAA